MRKNIVELRQHLAERFPQLRSGSEQLMRTSMARAAASEFSFDDLIAGHWPKGAIMELVQEQPSAGSGLILSACIRRLCPAHWVALIDGRDCFDPSAFDNATLSRLLWVRCDGAVSALKASDMLLRDRNVPFVLLDLAGTPVQPLRKIPATTWYRLQRVAELGSSVLLVVAPCHLVSCARVKFVLDRPFRLEALEQTETELLRRLRIQAEQKLLADARDPENKLAQAG